MNQGFNQPTQQSAMRRLLTKVAAAVGFTAIVISGRRIMTLGRFGTLVLVVGGIALVANGQVTPVAIGLNNPRGLAFGPGGILYVGEAGLGAGNGSGGAAPGIGFTGSVGEIRDLSSPQPTFERIISGLASANSEGVVGPDGVSPLGNGNIHIIMAQSTSGILANNPNANPALANQFGKLLKSSQSGQWKAVADVGDFDYQWTDQNKNAPWAPVGQFPDANPYAVLSVPGHEYIADAASNTVDEVDQNGFVRIVAFVPNPLLRLGPNLVPVSDSVPTCVAQGPDGFLYVGTLAFGAYFASGNTPQSKVYRINPALGNAILTDADVWASGFYPITGCGFGSGAFYVTEYFTTSPVAPGALIKIALNPDGSAGVRTIMGGGKLRFPNGFAAGPDGSVYVSNNSTSAGVAQTPGDPVGEVVRVDQ